MAWDITKPRAARGARRAQYKAPGPAGAGAPPQRNGGPQTRARVPPEARPEAYWQNSLVRYGCEDLHSRSETHSEAYWQHSALYATDVRIYTALL